MEVDTPKEAIAEEPDEEDHEEDEEDEEEEEGEDDEEEEESSSSEEASGEDEEEGDEEKSKQKKKKKDKKKTKTKKKQRKWKSKKKESKGPKLTELIDWPRDSVIQRRLEYLVKLAEEAPSLMTKGLQAKPKSRKPKSGDEGTDSDEAPDAKRKCVEGAAGSDDQEGDYEVNPAEEKRRAKAKRDRERRARIREEQWRAKKRKQSDQMPIATGTVVAAPAVTAAVAVELGERQPKRTKESEDPTPTPALPPPPRQPFIVRIPAGQQRAAQSPPVMQPQPQPQSPQGASIPLFLGPLAVMGLGTIRSDSPNFHTEQNIWPVGFKSSRFFVSYVYPERQC
jgi:hypothetical protein